MSNWAFIGTNTRLQHSNSVHIISTPEHRRQSSRLFTDETVKKKPHSITFHLKRDLYGNTQLL